MWTILAIIAAYAIVVISAQKGDLLFHSLILVAMLIAYGLFMAMSYEITIKTYNPTAQHTVIDEKTEYDYTFTLDKAEQDRAKIAHQYGNKIKFIQLSAWESERITNWAIWPFTYSKTIQARWIVVPYSTKEINK